MWTSFVRCAVVLSAFDLVVDAQNYQYVEQKDYYDQVEGSKINYGSDYKDLSDSPHYTPVRYKIDGPKLDYKLDDQKESYGPIEYNAEGPKDYKYEESDQRYGHYDNKDIYDAKGESKDGYNQYSSYDKGSYEHLNSGHNEYEHKHHPLISQFKPVAGVGSLPIEEHKHSTSYIPYPPFNHKITKHEPEHPSYGHGSAGKHYIDDHGKQYKIVYVDVHEGKALHSHSHIPHQQHISVPYKSEHKDYSLGSFESTALDHTQALAGGHGSNTYEGLGIGYHSNDGKGHGYGTYSHHGPGKEIGYSSGSNFDSYGPVGPGVEYYSKVPTQYIPAGGYGGSIDYSSLGPDFLKGFGGQIDGSISFGPGGPGVDFPTRGNQVDFSANFGPSAPPSAPGGQAQTFRIPGTNQTFSIDPPPSSSNPPSSPPPPTRPSSSPPKTAAPTQSILSRLLSFSGPLSSGSSSSSSSSSATTTRRTTMKPTPPPPPPPPPSAPSAPSGPGFLGLLKTFL